MRYRYLTAALQVATAVVAVASDDHGIPIERHHVTAPYAPLMQTAAQATAKSPDAWIAMNGRISRPCTQARPSCSAEPTATAAMPPKKQIKKGVQDYVK